MYLYQPLGHNNNLGDFGWVIPVVVGAAQTASYAVGIGKKWHETDKYLDKTKKTQQMTHSAQTGLKKEEAEAKQKLLLMKGQTELYRDARLKKIVIITVVTIIAIMILSVGTYIAFAAGSDDE